MRGTRGWCVGGVCVRRGVGVTFVRKDQDFRSFYFCMGETTGISFVDALRPYDITGRT